ncbi:MAG: PASTA domain-containing protein [Trueperaceae bacterium]|nr:PASTA domain-containing protein [Trueperaceae bacterium]
MSLLDGKYQVLSERRLSARERLYRATGPDGHAVDIVWYDLADADDELAFERFRQLLRTLKREGHAALRDIVARPGAHYVVWDAQAPTRPARVRQHDTLEPLLRRYDLSLGDLQFRRDANGQILVYDAPFDRDRAPRDTTSPRVYTRRGQLARALFAWLPGALLSLAGGVLLIASFYAYVDRPIVAVPALLGEDVNEAARQLVGLGFSVETEALTRYGTAGRVLELRPSPGTLLRAGRTVELRYLLPPDRLSPVNVPELRRGVQSEQELRALLAEADLQLGRVARISASIERGTVLAQSPLAGHAVAPGTRVDVLVSDGPAVALTFLPDCAGRARRAGLTVADRRYHDPCIRRPSGSRGATSRPVTSSSRTSRLTPPSPRISHSYASSSHGAKRR